MNDRITKRERGLLKGALRRVFSRSELRQKVLNTADIQHHDLSRPRVKKWSRCPVCYTAVPKYTMVVDHIDPVIPINSSFELMSLDTVVDRLWCIENNLQPLCEPCHTKKTKVEREERKLNKRGKTNVQSKRIAKTTKKRSPRATSRSSK
jgi:5-methylcytosine-specific restriction endonuclease McrA